MHKLSSKLVLRHTPGGNSARQRKARVPRLFHKLAWFSSDWITMSAPFFPSPGQFALPVYSARSRNPYVIQSLCPIYPSDAYYDNDREYSRAGSNVYSNAAHLNAASCDLRADFKSFFRKYRFPTSTRIGASTEFTGSSFSYSGLWPVVCSHLPGSILSAHAKVQHGRARSSEPVGIDLEPEPSFSAVTVRPGENSVLEHDWGHHPPACEAPGWHHQFFQFLVGFFRAANVPRNLCVLL